MIEFIATQLPLWRDRTDRPEELNEAHLTSQLCGHLNSAARRNPGWDFLQFRIEEPDEEAASRKIDLIPSACAATVWIEGRRHSDFDTILPIECKRLPTPKGRGRDEREYVFNQFKSTGGIQRFKSGFHGGGHSVGAMIAYLQRGDISVWSDQVALWIRAIVDAGEPGWSLDDLLRSVRDDSTQRLAILSSSHTRMRSGNIELRHLWIGMYN